MTSLQVVIDCAAPASLAPFWAEALHYQLAPPPPGFADWPAFLASQGVPEQEWNSASAIEDPAGVGPRVFLQRVPEPKTVKNRLHLDLHVAGGPSVPVDERERRIHEEAARLVALGARQVGEGQQFDHHWLVLHDPEGNEFCVG